MHRDYSLPGSHSTPVLPFSRWTCSGRLRIVVVVVSRTSLRIWTVVQAGLGALLGPETTYFGLYDPL